MTTAPLTRIAPTRLGRKTTLVVASVVYVWCGAAASQKQEPHAATPKADIKAGAETYGKYCSSCHGKRGRGDGPAAEALRIAPSDLTALARTYDGKFPRGFVSAVHDRSGQKHIDDLIAYLESIQVK
jgi:mono/diheme cytochrome c family protein